MTRCVTSDSALASRLERWFIYVLRDPISWDVRYVGKTSKPEARFRQHATQTHRSKHYNGYWLKSLRDKGLAPLFEVIDSGIGGGHQAAERAWISEYRKRGARLTNTGAGGLGFCDSPETRAKISATKTGVAPSPESVAKRAQANRGKRRSSEFCAKLSERNTGKPKSTETRARISAAKLGHKQSAETREKRAAALRGRKRDPEIGRKISAAKLGHRQTDETKAKLAAAQTGRSYSAEARANMAAAQKRRRVAEAEARNKQ